MFHFLPISNSFSKGSQLWIIQSPIHSKLSKKIDWYLQCICKKQKNLSKPILASADPHLPCKQVLFLPFENQDPVKWMQKAYQCWKNLDTPSLKLFLPESSNRENLTKCFPFEPLPYKIQVIQEPNVQEPAIQTDE